MKMKKFISLLGLVLMIAATVAACSSGGGGGGGGGSATALTVADKVSVVDAQLTSTVTAKPLLMGLFKLAPPANSDYNNDQTQVWVHERSVEGFNIINEILCMVAQTKYDSMLNQGAYTALVDLNQCSSERGDTSQASEGSQNQSSSATMPDYEEWTVDVTRADDNSPQIFKGWIHEKADEYEPAKLITVKATITEGKSDTNPYGIFTINFAAYPLDPGTGLPAPQIMFKGVLKSERDNAGKILLKFVCEATGGDQNKDFKQAVTLDRGTDDTGTGTVYEKEVHDEMGTPVTNEHTFNIAYNPSFFLRSEPTGSTVCLDRVNFDESAWRYGLYDETTGARINRNSGFSINTAADGSGSHGWVGYWGIWIDNNGTLSNNQTVYQYDYNTKTSAPYTVFKADGKLKKHTKQNLTLGEVKGVPLDFWESDPITYQGSNYRVVWTGSVFNKTAQMVCGSNNTNCNWSNLANPVAIDISHLQWSELNFWSQSLGGQVRVPLGTISTPCTFVTSTTGPGYTDCSNNAPADGTSVIFFKEDIVYPSDTVPATLRCYDNCLHATSSGIDPNNPTYSNTWDPNTGQPLEHNYTFNSVTMLLEDGLYSVVATTTGQMNQWGYGSGALFEPTTANLDLLKCDWPYWDGTQNVYGICGWKAWSALDVFYTWETGPNNWNQFTGLKDSGGTFLTFQPPLQVKYVHSEAGSPFNNATFLLEYSGFGNLWGIPGKCVNMDTGLEVDCSTGGPGSPVRWVPAFAIPTGATVANGTTNYLAKPLEMEQRMKQDTSGGCSQLTASSYTLPVITDWTDPNIGTEPAITDPPAVIGGVVQ